MNIETEVIDPIIKAPETKPANNNIVDLKQVIKAPTDYKAPTGLNIKMPEINQSDFVEAPYIKDAPGFEKKPETTQGTTTTTQQVYPGNQTPEIVVKKTERIFDPDFTADIVVDTFDTIQHPLFLALNHRKQKRLRFKDRDEYLEAVKLSYLTDPELKNMENYEEKKILVEKLKTFVDVMAKIKKDLALTPEQVAKLKKPTLQLIKQHPDFDIPPGLALMLAFIDIISDRVIDLIVD
ncbi:MAG: hypothetical protein PHX80_05560 [Candidatus Nanoarchaeia archaeon]|nr:hypothetical protein [Candidatus Nanoarchaeia archaeon]